ncbi:hypothetical protein K502DRAFT_349263 [Neoconidiobolus thromboides FSU 785]|nr:hypothetical protein K502DRAFT_349263 [Neoconidiobolus thromboides FSU 785]
MSTFDNSNWLHEIFNLKLFEHSDGESIDIAIKKEHDCIIYLYKLSKLKSNSQSEKKKYINEMVALISSHCITEETIIYPVLLQILGEQSAMKLLQEHRKLCNDMYNLSLLYGKKGICDEFEKGLDEIIDEFQIHARDEENYQMPTCLKELTQKEQRSLLNSYLEFKKVDIKKINPLAPDNPILGE